MKISIITPTLNSIRTLSRCVDSVKSQTYSNIEYIIIDGGSTDGTLEYLQNIEKDFSDIKIISSKDRGVYDAMNKGISLATGEIVHILNSDDYYAKNSVIETVVNLFKNNRTIDLVHAKVKIIEGNKKINEVGKSVTFKKLLRKMYVAHPIVFLKRDIYKKYGVFCDSFRIAADYEFMLRIWNKINKYFIDEVLVYMSNMGISNRYIELSIRERTSISIKYGANPILSIFWMYRDIFVSKNLYPIYLKLKKMF